MEDIKKYEAAVIRRACYMVNTSNFDEKVFTRAFYFTDRLPYDKWYEQAPRDSWILTSFYKACRLFSERQAENRAHKAKIEQEVLIPACQIFNDAIDRQNIDAARVYSDDFIIENATEALTQQGYPYDYVQKRAREMANDPDVRAKFYDNLSKNFNAPFEKELENMHEDFKFNASNLWQPSSKQYRHITPADIRLELPLNKKETANALDLSGADVKNFAEYQYVLAIDDILAQMGIDDARVNAIMEAGDKLNLRPEPHDNGFPGAKWDILQTVWDREPDLEKDLIALVHYCANNREPHIKESWLFQYANPLPVDLTEEEKEAEDLLVETAKLAYSDYVRTIVALAKCVQVNSLKMMMKAIENVAGESLSDREQTCPTMAERMEDYYLSSYSFKNDDKRNFLLDIITIMQSDNMEIDITGMEQFLDTDEESQAAEKKNTSDEKPYGKMIGWGLIGVGALMTVVGGLAIDPLIVPGVASLIAGIVVYRKNKKKEK